MPRKSLDSESERSSLVMWRDIIREEDSVTHGLKLRSERLAVKGTVE